MVKLDNKYIKNKLKAKFGELEVYNPQLILGVHDKLVSLIKENSQQVNLKNNKTDVQINNVINIMRYMLIHLTNIEDKAYWNNINDSELENMLNLADGDFKQVANILLDIILEIGQDIRVEEIRKLKIIKEKLKEVTEVFNFNKDINESLAKFGLDKDKLGLIQNGDKQAIEEFQNNLIEQASKYKRKTKKTK